MADAILSEWRPLASHSDGIASVQSMVDEYISLVYKRNARPPAGPQVSLQKLILIQFSRASSMRFPMRSSGPPTQSWPSSSTATNLPLPGVNSQNGWETLFFVQLADHLALELPRALKNDSDFNAVGRAIDRIGRFLQLQGYLRSHFAFRFDVTAYRGDLSIAQKRGDFLQELHDGGTAYALYEMGHPVILPSAVYLYLTVGEAQHHSSRTIEEMFSRIGCDAWETDDFDPSDFPSDLVVELWQVRLRSQIG